MVAVPDKALATAAAAGEVPQNDEMMVDLDEEDNLEIEPEPEAGTCQAAPGRLPQQEGAPLRIRLTSGK